MGAMVNLNHLFHFPKMSAQVFTALFPAKSLSFCFASLKVGNRFRTMVQFNLIVARCQNNGIGYKGALPWELRKEMKYFLKMTKDVQDPGKKNAVVMGRKTWDSIPDNFKPMPGRLNLVLSRQQQLDLKGAVLCSGFDDLVKKINSPDYVNDIETAWIIGGSDIYKEAVNRNICHRLYITNIFKDFKCDTFFDVDFNDGFKEVSDERVPKGIQEENEIQYSIHVYEKLQ